MKKLFSIFLTLLLAICESCGIDPNPKTELEKLPAATQEGKNTFGCLVNGKALVAQSSIDAVSYYQSGTFFIGTGISGSNHSISLSVHEVGLYILQEQTYNLTKIPDAMATFTNSGSPTCFYESENTINGSLKITKLNKADLIVSGLFEFTTVVSGCDTIKVTDGRFDLTYAN